MKLNLLPTYVSKEGQTKMAAVVSVLLGVLGIGSAVGMILYSNQQLDRAKAEAESLVKPAQDALATSRKADEIMKSAVVVDRNLKLANAMTKHNAVYPDLYREVLGYVPSFFRVTQVAATPVDANVATIQMSGVLQTLQQYADVVIAMLRIPGVVNVARANFNVPRASVPNLVLEDQDGRPVVTGQPNLPSDPLDRLDALVARASEAPRGFLNTGGFGSDEPARGAMPGWSPVTLTITIQRNLQVPNPRATLAAQGAAGGGAPAGTPAGFGAPGGAPPPGGSRRLAEDDD